MNLNTAGIHRTGVLPQGTIIAQQPPWPHSEDVKNTIDQLPPRGFIDPASIQNLNTELTGLHQAGGLILQAGDCVEDLSQNSPAETQRKANFYQELSQELHERTGRQTLTVGRIAGQYAKPRSQDYETINGEALPSYRGPIVNSPEPTQEARTPDPRNITWAHYASAQAAETLAANSRNSAANQLVWTSHEMLLLDYERHYLQELAGGTYLTTTHWPWIGARTNDLRSAHIALAASFQNPISVKIGPGTTPEKALQLAELLNPDDIPGRLTLIVRYGHEAIDGLREVVRELKKGYRNLMWISDPMHGNTVKAASGLKTRHLEHIIAEIRGFQTVLRSEDIEPHGLHVEATPDDVYECSENHREPTHADTYRTLLDPRLNPAQALAVVSAWTS